ncbi:hypothetical protein Tco_0196096 [Tanacetum coccineum]
MEAKLSSRGSMSVASMYQTLSCMSRLSSRGSVYVAGMHQTLSSGSKLSSCSSTCCGPDVCDIRTLYVSRLFLQVPLSPELVEVRFDRMVMFLDGSVFGSIRRFLVWLRPDLSSFGGGLVRRLDLRRFSRFSHQSFEVLIKFYLVLLMAKKDMHIYVSQLKDVKLKTLIATYDIPLNLSPRLPDSNFRMINLPAGDTAIGVYSRIFDSSGVRIPFSSFLLAVLKYFKVHISQLVPLGLAKVITFEVLCRSLDIEPTVTLFRVFQTLSKQGDWFSFAKRGGSAPVCMEVTKSGLKQWKEKKFLIDRRAIPFHMPWRHPDSCITDKVPTSFNQDHVDRLKAHIVKLRDIPEGVLVRSGLSRVWRNPMCDPVLRRSDNTAMSIHDFLCMPSLEKATVRDEPHELGTSILSRVAVTRPDRNVVAKADHAAKRKTSTGPEISTNTAKRTRLSQKVSRAGSSGLAARDEVEQTDDGTLADDDQRDGLEFAMEDVGNINDVGQGEHINVIPLRTFDPSLGLDVTYPPILLPNKEVEAHAELFGDARRTTRASSTRVGEDASSPAQEAVPAPGTQPLDTDAGADEIASDGNVDSYFDARVSNTAGDVLERDLLSFVPGPYYIPYPYDKNNGCESPPYTKDDWDEIHGVNLGLRRKELYKDPKVCRTAIDRFPTPVEIHRLHEFSSAELSDRMSVLQCQLITHGRAFHARYDHSLREVERLAKRCAQQTQIFKKQNADLKQHKESVVHASEEVSGLKAELGALKSKCEATEHKLSSWDKKHRKYRSERDTLAKEKAKIEEELKSRLEHRSLKSREFNRAFAGVLNTTISVGVERGLRMGRTDEEFRGLSQRVAGFIPDAKEKFDRVIAAFPDTTFPFLDKVSQHSQSSLQDIARLEPDMVDSSSPAPCSASLRT